MPKETVHGYFYSQNDQRIVFDIRWSDWSTQFRRDDEYDTTRVEAASLNFVLQIREATSFDFEEFLADEEFTGCRRF